MENTDNQHNRHKLSNLKFVNSEIYEHDCNIKGEPIVNIDAERISFSVIFPTRITKDQAEFYGKQITKCVNMHDELVAALETLFKCYIHEDLLENRNGGKITENDILLLLNRSEQKLKSTTMETKKSTIDKEEIKKIWHTAFYEGYHVKLDEINGQPSTGRCSALFEKWYKKFSNGQPQL